MIIHFFTKGDRGAGSSRLRAFFVADYLNNLGCNTVVHSPSTLQASQTRWPRKITLLWEYLKIIKNIDKDDVIFLQRTLYNKYFLIIISIYKLIFRRKMIFDFDDAMYVYLPYKTAWLSWISDAVIVAFKNSQTWAGRFNNNVYYVPTSIPFEIYSRQKKSFSNIKKPWVIGWIGNAHDQFVNLKLLGPALFKLKKNNISFKFRLIGAIEYKPVYEYFQNLLGENVEFIDSLEWGKPEVVIDEIIKFDISLVPLVFDEWNRGKYSLKALESMALGIPTVVSATDGAKELIQNETNGFLVQDEADWVNAIMKIMSMDKNAYEELGLSGRKTVEELYSLEANVPKIKNIIYSL